MTTSEKVRCRVAVDIGGTFTDLVFQNPDTGEGRTGKILSTPDNLATAVLDGLRTFLPSEAEMAFLIHGTTVGLNAVLERRGARVALVTTANFRDVYTIAGNDRRDIFSIHYRKPSPLVSPESIFTIRERMRADGSVQAEPELEDLDELIAAARERDFDAVAVCLIFSYVNSAHELAVERYLQERLPDLPVTLSHRVSPEWREYARTSTAVMDAYIAPVVRRYLSALMAELDSGLSPAPLHVMESNGGAMTAAAAHEKPIQTLLSGPVGGTIGAESESVTLNRPNLICVDMGGTSFDASLIVDGRPSTSSEAELEGLPIQMSIVDIHVIGAGGGSIAWLEGGHIRVGPQSAGSEPGPACYGRGGADATVTDANLVLGRIDPETFAGGRMQLDVEAARGVIAEIGGSLGLALEDMAQGILDIINAKMADAIRTITVQKGIDPRDFALFAYGGAGPMHAVALADQLDIREVIVPSHPGTFSAWGMLQTNIRHDLKRTYFALWDTVDLSDLEHAYEALEEEGRGYLRQEDIVDADIVFTRTADLRYQGQEYQLTCDIPSGPINPERVRQEFDEAYVRQYGHTNPDSRMEIVNLRVIATGLLARSEPTPSPVEAQSEPKQRERDVFFSGQRSKTQMLSRDGLATGHDVVGPAVIDEQTATTIVPPGWTARVVAGGHLSITRT